MKPLVKPTVNLNGSSRDSLVEANANAASAIRKALETVVESKPHGRDFQINGGYEEANEAWHERYIKLVTIAQEFEDLAIVLVNEG